MTQIAIAARVPGLTRSGVRELLGTKSGRAQTSASFGTQTGTIQAPTSPSLPLSPAPVSAPVQIANEIEKTVRRMPTLYVIAFFGVVVACAVFIIWNTLQVNRLTAERTRLDDGIAQTEQKLIRLRAEQMQLSAPSRVNDIAHARMGMVEAMSEDIVVVK